MTGMRILTVRQPWAWAIIHGGKDVENRSRNLAGDYRGPIAIHVAQVEDNNAFSLSQCTETLNAAADRWVAAAVAARPKSVRSVPWGRDHGRIIGVVDLVDVHRVINTAGRFHCETITAPTDPAASGACSPWAEKEARHIVLANPRPLTKPIPYRGAQGLRHLPPDITQQVLALAEEKQ